jgi:hypothetical protein
MGVQGFEFRVSGFGVRGLGLRNSGLGFKRVKALQVIIAVAFFWVLICQVLYLEFILGCLGLGLRV